MSRFQSDSLRPSALSSALLGRSRLSGAGTSSRSANFEAPSAGDGSGNSGNSANSAQAQRERSYEEWNVKVDQQVKAVSTGLKELVQLADIGTNPNSQATHPLPALHLKLRTSQLIRATQTLRDTAHELKLLLLLSDEMDIARRRDEEVRAVRKEVQQGRKAVARGYARLVQQDNRDAEVGTSDDKTQQDQPVASSSRAIAEVGASGTPPGPEDEDEHMDADGDIDGNDQPGDEEDAQSPSSDARAEDDNQGGADGSLIEADPNMTGADDRPDEDMAAEDESSLPVIPPGAPDQSAIDQEQDQLSRPQTGAESPRDTPAESAQPAPASTTEGGQMEVDDEEEDDFEEV